MHLTVRVMRALRAIDFRKPGANNQSGVTDRCQITLTLSVHLVSLHFQQQWLNLNVQVVSVAAGHRHIVCATRNGGLYTWGEVFI